MDSRTFRKSTYSGGSNECVEVGSNGDTLDAIGDTKTPDGPALTFNNGQALAGLVAMARATMPARATMR
jgi:hypothetical protein